MTPRRLHKQSEIQRALRAPYANCDRAAGNSALRMGLSCDRVDLLFKGDRGRFSNLLRAYVMDRGTAFYMNKADLFLARGDSARMRAYIDSAWRLETRVADDPNQPAYMRRSQNVILAWLSALRGERVQALSVFAESRTGSQCIEVSKWC